MTNRFRLSGLDAHHRLKLAESAVTFVECDPSGDSILIEEGDKGRALAALQATAVERSSLTAGVTDLVLQFKKDRSRGAAQLSPAQLQARAESRQRYIKARSINSQSDIDGARASLAALRAELAVALVQLSAASRAAFLLEEGLTEDGYRALFAEEWQGVLSHPKVRDARVGVGHIFIFTEMLRCRDSYGGGLHEIGEFLIVINLDGTGGGVRWFNKSHRRHGVAERMNAPRVYQDGTAVVDEIAETLCELIARGEFSTVADLAIQFIETPVADVAGTQVRQWPAAS